MKCVVEFPVELGQKVYRISPFTGEPEPVWVEKLVFKSCRPYMQLSCNAMYETSCSSIGKSVFLSFEEAEKHVK